MKKNISETEFAWLVGILEGEGSFSRQKTGKTSYSPRLDVAMIDNDIVERVASLMETSVHRIRRIRTQDLWRTSIQGKRAMTVAMAAYPWLGERRRRQISEMWKNYTAMPGPGWAKGKTWEEMGR